MRLGVVVLLLIAAGCGQPSEETSDLSTSNAPTPTQQKVASAPDATPVKSAMRLEGVDLYMHDYTPTDGQLREPTLWVHAASGQLAENNQVWSLQDTHAVIYRADDDDLIVDASHGEFDQANESAVLTGSVRLTTGSMVVDLESLVWDNAEGAAISDNPVRVTQGDTWLIGSTMRLSPDADTLLLTEGSGFLRLVEVTP